MRGHFGRKTRRYHGSRTLQNKELWIWVACAGCVGRGYINHRVRERWGEYTWRYDSYKSPNLTHADWSMTLSSYFDMSVDNIGNSSSWAALRIYHNWFAFASMHGIDIDRGPVFLTWELQCVFSILQLFFSAVAWSWRVRHPPHRSVLLCTMRWIHRTGYSRGQWI